MSSARSGDSSGADSPEYTRMSNAHADEERKERDGSSVPLSPRRQQQQQPVSFANLMPEPSVSHVNFHHLEDEEDVQARLSPQHTEQQSSSAEVSRQPSMHSFPNQNSPPVIIAFINFHSGGKAGEALAAELILGLGEKNVFDLKGDGGAANGLRKFKGTPNLRVVIGGGDGTINWVLSQMRMEGMTEVPAGCIPLGTGNDSSRAFGWGHKLPSSKKIHKNIDRMRTNRPDTFLRYDRWHAFVQYVEPASAEFIDALPASLRAIRSEADIPEFYRHPKAISLPSVPSAHLAAQLKPAEDLPRPHRAATIDRDAREEGYNVAAVALGDRGKHAPDVPLDPLPAVASGNQGPERGPGRFFGSEFNNYLSWGVDAQIQSQFHHKRESCRECFCCRPCNMAWMGCFGALNFCGCQSQELDCSVEVRDEEGRWVNVPLPPGIKTIVLLNTPTYGGGRFLWGQDKAGKVDKPREWECASQPQATDDGLFEIVGIKSVWHLGMVMGKFTRGIRLAQVDEARVTFRTRTFAQADGEPYYDLPGTYHIRPLRPATLITRPDKRIHPSSPPQDSCC